MQLELNKKYLNRNGKVVEICVYSKGSIFPWADVDGRSYRDDGAYDYSPCLDLLSEASQESTNKPHVHSEYIKAWANGAEIQYLCTFSGIWTSFTDPADPSWWPNAKYRIKPEVKPNYFKFGKLDSKWTGVGWTNTPYPCDNIQAEFSGETNELISVKLIKDTYENRAY